MFSPLALTLVVPFLSLVASMALRSVCFLSPRAFLVVYASWIFGALPVFYAKLLTFTPPFSLLRLTDFQARSLLWPSLTFCDRSYIL